MSDNKDLEDSVSELELEPETNSNGKGKPKRRMTGLALAITLLVVFVGCNKTDAQNKQAISNTQTAMAGPFQIVRRAGCTNKFAINYDQWATANDGSCKWPTDRTAPIVPGCTDSNATNYDSTANWMSGTCKYKPAPANEVPGCTDPNAVNLNRIATWNDGSCVYKMIPISGCTDEYASNHVPAATADDYSCVYAPLAGCIDSNATNFNSAAKQDDGSCLYSKTPMAGCTDPKASNYNKSASQDDGSCKYEEAVLPEGFPANVPYGNYTMSCNGQNYGSFTNNNISKFAQDTVSTLRSSAEQGAAACSGGPGCTCSSSVSGTPWNGTYFTLTLKLSITCCIGGECMTTPVSVACTYTAK